MEDPKIWDDPKRAQELGKEKKALEDIVLVLEAVDNGVNDGRELFAMGKDDNDDDTYCLRKDLLVLIFLRPTKKAYHLTGQGGGFCTDSGVWPTELVRVGSGRSAEK